MDINERFEVPAAADRVWALLSDVETVAACLQGAELVSGQAGIYDGRLRVAFGPTTAVFSGQADIDYDQTEKRATIAARGRDARGATRAAANVTVMAEPAEAGCVVAVDGTLDVNGPLAQFARTGGIHVTRELLQDFATCLGERAGPNSHHGALDHVDPSARGAALDEAGRGSRPTIGGLRLLWRALRSWFRDVLGQDRKENDR